MRLFLTALALLITAIASNYFTQQQTSESPKDPFDFSSIKQQERSTLPLSVHCENPQIGKLLFQSEVVTHDFLANSHDLNNHPDRIANEQLKYLNGYFNFADHSSLRVVPFSNKALKILKVEKLKYPLNVTVDKIEANTVQYSDSALERNYAKGDKAIKVTYEAEVSVKVCSPDKVKTETVSIILPIDPYLAFWFVPKDMRAELSYHPKVKMVTNPCSANQMADLKYPSMYWYAWKPEALSDLYNCKKYLSENNYIQNISAKFAPDDFALNKIAQENLNFSHLKNKETIKIALINGFIFKKNMSELLLKAKEILPYLNKLKDTPREILRGQDPSTIAAYTIVNSVNEMSESVKWETREAGVGSHLIFKAAGILKESKKKFEMNIYLGPSTEYQEGEKHWNFLAEAFSQADFIFYNGHAGMGTTFSLSELKKQTPFSGFEQSPEHQFVGVLSCYSAAYYGPDIVLERTKLGKQTDILLTGFEGYSYLLAPAIIKYVDLELSGAELSLQEIMGRFLHKSFDVHLTRYVSNR